MIASSHPSSSNGAEGKSIAIIRERLKKVVMSVTHFSPLFRHKMFFSDVVSLLIPPCRKIRLQSEKVGNNGDEYRGIGTNDGSNDGPNSLALLATTSREKGSSIQ
jgi:hypothetical protein